MFDNLRAKIALAMLPKGNINPFQVLSTRSPDIPIYSPMTVEKATREGYKVSVYVFRAVRTIVQAASAIPWVVTDPDGNQLPKHPLKKVLDHPNVEFSGQDLNEIMIAHLELVGNALWMPVIVQGQVKEIWPVMPDLVKPIPSKTPGEWLKGWEISSYDGTLITTEPDRFLHFMQMDPGDLYWGTSPLIAAARTIDTDNDAQDMQKISMQNRGVTDGVFSHETPMTQEQFVEARRQVRENFLGKTKAREPWVLGAGTKWQQMSMSPLEMDFIASRLQNKRDIAGAFGISPIFLGDLEQSSYNNMMEARKALYEDVVIPLLDDAKSTLNLKIAPLYGGEIVIAYDTSKVAALREDFGKKVEQAKNLWSMGVPFQLVNERLEMGFDEFEGWDVGYLPFNLAPAGSTPAELTPVEGGKSIKTINITTEKQKDVYWKLVDRRRMAWWGVVSKKVIPLYEAEAKAVLDAVKGKAPGKLVEAASRAIQSERSQWEKTITAISASIVADFGEQIADDLGVEKSDNLTERKWTFDPMSVAARAWIAKHGAASVTSILDTNLEDVKMVILAGVEENQTTTQIAKNLRQFYDDRSPFKSMRIARTETSQAAGFGQREAAKQSGIVKTKQWISSRDDRVRDEHLAMDSDSHYQAVPIDEPYPNGEMYPGENSIMCRCAESFGTGR